MHQTSGRNIPDRVIIISLDAMGARDLEYMRTLPHFKAFSEHAGVCGNVSSVYPSLTYPAHTSIVTGRQPVHHGIINNTQFQPERPSPDWFWQRKYIRGTTLYDEAIRTGWKTAALLWPVTAQSHIHYNIPEVLANRPWQNQYLVSLLNSTPGYVLLMNRLFGHLREGVKQPALDHFVHASALYTINRYNPDLFLIHLTDLDTNRHIYGLDHEKTFEAMQRHDKRLGELLEALAKTGDMDKTTVILLGDHCQKDTKRAVYLNHALKENGYLQTKGKKIISYQAIAKNCDGSCYLYLNPKAAQDDDFCRELKNFVELLARDETYGIERIHTAQEAAALGADAACFLMLEAAEGVYFLDEFDVAGLEVSDIKKHKMRATHGYLPDKSDYKTFFMAKGCGIKQDVVIPSMKLYDEGPTIARLMGLDLGDVDGREIEELLDF